MKVLSVSAAKAKFGRVIDQVIKSRDPVVIPRGGGHVIIAPYDLPTPDVIELLRIRTEMDKSGVNVEESESSLQEIREVVAEYRNERRRKKK